jgi:hypothetical protein
VFQLTDIFVNTEISFRRCVAMGPYLVTLAARYTASFLRLFVPNSLAVPHPSVGSSSFRYASSCRVPRLPDKVFVSPNFRLPRQWCLAFALSLTHTDPHRWGANSWSGRGSLYPTLLAPLPFCAWEGVDPSTMSSF